MNKAFLRWSLFASLLLLFIAAGAPNAFGNKPPWAGEGGKKKAPPVQLPPIPDPVTDPVSAPEPITLSLIGVGLAGAAGYYLVNIKRKK